MSEITNEGTQVTPKYYKGYITGMHLDMKATYSGVEFHAEADWEVPEERRCYAEEFDGTRMGQELAHAHAETGIRMQLYKKIWEWQAANEA